MAAAVRDLLISLLWKSVLKCSFLYPEKALCSQAGNSAQQQQCDVCAPREGAIRIPVGNVLGTSADLRQRFSSLC